MENGIWEVQLNWLYKIGKMIFFSFLFGETIKCLIGGLKWNFRA